MRDALRRRLRKHQLRSNRSERPSGPCAEWRTQQPSIGCEGDDDGPHALGRWAEPPRWAWASDGLGGKSRLGLHVRCV